MTDEHKFDTNVDTAAEPPDVLASDFSFIAQQDCPLSHGGVNLVTLRRFKLREIARALGLDDGGSKNELLHRILADNGIEVRLVKRMTREQFNQLRAEVL